MGVEVFTERFADFCVPIWKMWKQGRDGGMAAYLIDTKGTLLDASSVDNLFE